MKTQTKSCIATALCSVVFTLQVCGQGTAFTYQGRLADGSAAAGGLYDLRFTIYDAASAGNADAGPLTKSATPVSDGLFTVTLDFGAAVFTGAERWLEVAVRTNGAGAFTPLDPRQKLYAAPYAMLAAETTSTNTARLNPPNSNTRATAVPVINSGFITGATLTDGGSGYVSAPAVMVSDATGSGAVLTATVAGGQVTALTVNAAGGGYSSGATITIGAPPSNAYQVFRGTNIFGNVGNLFAGTFIGNGTALTGLNASNLSSGTVPDARLPDNLARLDADQTFSGVNTFSGANTFIEANTFVGANTFNNPGNNFTGNGAGLSGLNAASLSSGTVPDARLSANLARLNLNQTFSAVNTFNHAANSFSGSGAGLTGLNAANLSSGTVPDARLSTNLARLNANQTYSGINTFSGVNIFNNSGNSFTGTGAGLLGLNASSLSSGTVPDARIPATIARDSELLPMVLAGDGAGSGLDADLFDGLNSTAFALAGHTHSGADIVSGTVADARLSANVALLNLNQTFSGQKTFNNAANSFIGNGAGLTSLSANALASGIVPDARLAANVPRANQVWLLGGNASTTPGTQFLGTTDNQPLEIKVNGLRAARFEYLAGTPNVILGSAVNFVAGAQGTTIAGGGTLGLTNSILASYGAMGGGQGNRIAPEAISSSIAGGQLNDIGTNADHSTIGGGSDNNIGSDSSDSTIAGGVGNDIGTDSDWSVVGGGVNNNIGADSWGSTIAGGRVNDIGTNSDHSVVGGGFDNDIGANAVGATIGGGSGNSIQANADCATIPGGSNNIASGAYSFAAGRRARASSAGSFVWADSQDADFNGGLANSVFFRCQGGVRFTSGLAGTGQTVGWTPGGLDWGFSSDRNLKDRVTDVDTREVLEKVSRLPLTEWSFKGHSQRHIGPMAQDFHALFPFNETDTMIDSGDLQGVALAAIQGLNQKVNEQQTDLQRKLEQKETEITELKARLTDLERILSSLKTKEN